MNLTLIIGTRIVILALIFYSIGIFLEQRKRYATNSVLISLTIGIILDITATIFMIIGSPNSPFSMHGFLGYSSLTAMFIDIVLIWRFRLNNDASTLIKKSLHIYSRYAYIWWLIAFVTGALLVFVK